MNGARLPRLLGISVALFLAACATAPPIEVTTPDSDEPTVLLLPPPSPPMIESPPIEPVEPPDLPAPTPTAAPTPQAPAPTPTPVPVAPPPRVVIVPSPAPVVVIPEPPSDDSQVAALVGDLARYATIPPEEVRKELNGAIQSLARQRTDANRVRLAMLYTLTHSPQDDQRALQHLENVTKSTPGSLGIKLLAGVLQIQVVERVRAVREEQQKADAAIQKLEALRVMERSLLRDRVRSGGGGGGGGSGSGGSGR